MPKGSAVEKVEKKLKKEYPGNPGAVYGTLNKAGLMRGNKATAKGKKKASADFSEGNPSQAIGSSRPAAKVSRKR